MRKILIVEDNDMSRDALSRRLARRGFCIVTAIDGVDGIECAQREAPDLILMDMSLPRVDGWEATRRLKAADETRAIPIIALTARATRDDLDLALAAGCVDCDTKPVDFARLLEKIAVVLDRH